MCATKFEFRWPKKSRACSSFMTAAKYNFLFCVANLLGPLLSLSRLPLPYPSRYCPTLITGIGKRKCGHLQAVSAPLSPSLWPCLWLWTVAVLTGNLCQYLTFLMISSHWKGTWPGQMALTHCENIILKFKVFKESGTQWKNKEEKNYCCQSTQSRRKQ